MGAEAPRPGETPVILVADDEEMLRKLIEVMLHRQYYRVLLASDGTEALGMARAYSERIDLLVTDVQMPDMSGFDLAEQLRSERPGLRVLILSSDPSYAEDTNLPFLGKPFSQEKLCSKIQEVLSAPMHAGGR